MLRRRSAADDHHRPLAGLRRQGATAIRTELAGRPRVLGPTSVFAPSASRGKVWLAYLAVSAAASVRLVSVAGRWRGPLIRLPRRSQLVAGTDAGLLLQDRRGLLRLWRPGTAARLLPHSPSWADGIGVTAGLIAYGTGCHDAASSPGRLAALFRPDTGYRQCSVLRVLHARTGRVDSFRAPAGTTGWVPPEFGLENPISTPGSMIAAESVVPSADNNRGRLYVLRLTGGRRRGAGPVVDGLPVQQGGVVARRYVAVLPGSWRDVVGLPDQHRRGPRLVGAVLPVHRDGRGPGGLTAASCHR